MRMRYHMRRTSILCLFLVISVFLFARWCELLYGNDSLSAGRESLIDKHHQIETKLEKSAFGIPVYLESSVEKNASRVDIYGIVKYPFTLSYKMRFRFLPTGAILYCRILM